MSFSLIKAIRVSGYYKKCSLKFVFIYCVFLLSGCFSSNFQPTYKEADICANIKKICLEEYNLKVVPIKTGNTLWVYVPLDKMLHADFGKNPDKIFDEEMIGKARNILTGISRVLLSSDKAPDFFVLNLSDIKLGLDYSLTANFLDIKRSFIGGIPWNEANKRYVINFRQSEKAINDNSGAHLETYDIKFPEFLSQQIVQRIRSVFQEEPVNKYFELKGVDAGFQDNKLFLVYSAAQVSRPDKEINIPRKILEVITYCLKTYEFKDFTQVVIKDLWNKKSSVYEYRDIWARSIQ